MFSPLPVNSITALKKASIISFTTSNFRELQNNYNSKKLPYTCKCIIAAKLHFVSD